MHRSPFRGLCYNIVRNLFRALYKAPVYLDYTAPVDYIYVYVSLATSLSSAAHPASSCANEALMSSGLAAGDMYHELQLMSQEAPEPTPAMSLRTKDVRESAEGGKAHEETYETQHGFKYEGMVLIPTCIRYIAWHLVFLVRGWSSSGCL